MNTQDLANTVDTAANTATAIPQLSTHSTFNVDESYAIQAASIENRYARGEQFIGLKMGFTSEAKMVQMGVHDMIWGRLTDAMLIQNGGQLNMSQCIHPRAEPELAFRVSKAIEGELSAEEVRNYVDGVAAAIEIIDSRYENFKFSLEDVIADNCSSCGLVIGEWQDPSQPVGDLAIALNINGEAKHTGTSAAILGDPWKAVAAATRLAEQYKQPIPAGSIIMAGAATAAEFLAVGNSVEATVEGLGSVGFEVG